MAVTIGTQTPARVGADAVLDFKVQVALGDSPLSAEELEALRTAGDNLVLLRNPDSVDGAPVLSGFRLDLSKIW